MSLQVAVVTLPTFGTLAMVSETQNMRLPNGLSAQSPALQQRSPEGLLQAVIQLLLPLVGQELDDLLPAGEADAVDVPLRVCRFTRTRELVRREPKCRARALLLAAFFTNTYFLVVNQKG